MKHLKGLPEDVPLALYAMATGLTPTVVRKLFADFFFSLSPDVPYDLSKRIREKGYRRLIGYGAAIGFLFCFCTTGAFCYFENVLFPAQCQLEPAEKCDRIQFFLTDHVNIIMYTLVTPATVGIGLALLLATITTWRTLDEVLGRERSALIGWKGFAVGTLIVVASSIAIASYISDVVNPKGEMGAVSNNLHFWFLGDPATESTLKPITVYYTILNFLILVFTLSCVAVFVTAVQPIVKLSNLISVRKLPLDKEAGEGLVDKMAPFADCYLFAKMLLAITMIHSIVWSYSPLAVTNNFNLERGFIVFVSVFFIAIPRLHFELEWYRSALFYREQGVNIELAPKYIRGFHYTAIWAADFLIVGGYLISVLGFLDFGPFAP